MLSCFFVVVRKTSLFFFISLKVRSSDFIEFDKFSIQFNWQTNRKIQKKKTIRNESVFFGEFINVVYAFLWLFWVKQLWPINWGI